MLFDEPEVASVLREVHGKERSAGAIPSQTCPSRKYILIAANFNKSPFLTSATFAGAMRGDLCTDHAQMHGLGHAQSSSDQDKACD